VFSTVGCIPSGVRTGIGVLAADDRPHVLYLSCPGEKVQHLRLADEADHTLWELRSAAGVPLTEFDLGVRPAGFDESHAMPSLPAPGQQVNLSVDTDQRLAGGVSFSLAELSPTQIFSDRGLEAPADFRASQDWCPPVD
jgi:hypothetical protein